MKVWQARVIGGELRLQHGDTNHARGLAHAWQELARSQTEPRELLYRLQQEVAEQLTPVDCPLQHSLIDGVYVRTIFIPAGTVIVGKIHKHRHANILSQGEVLVITEGEGARRLKGPLTMVSPAGCKRAVRALTDTTWTTIHATDETDLDKIEDWVIAKTYEEYEQFALEREAMQQIEVTP